MFYTFTETRKCFVVFIDVGLSDTFQMHRLLKLERGAAVLGSILRDILP